jgi:hypothetical protein
MKDDKPTYFESKQSLEENLKLHEKMIPQMSANSHLYKRDGYIIAMYERKTSNSEYEVVFISNHDDFSNKVESDYGFTETKDVNLSDFQHTYGVQI